MLTLDSVVGELHIVSGQRQTATLFTGAFTAPRRSARGRQDDTLFVLVDPSGPHALIPDLIQRIQQVYWQVTGSVTAGLRAAIEAGNAWLIDRNQSAPAGTSAGVTCAVLRGSEIFTVQAGPSNAYVAHQGALERFPRGGEIGSLPPLGIARAVEVRFSHAELHPGDVLLLTDAAFPTRTPLEAVTSSIVYVGVEAALNNLARLSGGESLIALVVEVTAAVAAPETKGAHPPVEQKGASQPRAPIPQPKPLAPQPKAAMRPPGETPGSKGGEWAGAVRQGVERGLGSLGTGARAMVQRALPDRPAPPARRHAPRRPLAVEQNMPLMVGLAIGIPLIVAILVSAVYLERRTAAQVEALLTDARQVMAEASAPAASDVKRERWRTALAKAAEALSLDAENREALDLRTQAQTQLDSLDGTQRVSPALLHDFKAAGAYRLSLSDIHLFVMEQTNDRVDRLTLTSDGGAIEGSGPAPVLARGISVSERALGDLIDMAWVEAGGARQQSGLIILERGGLIEYSLRFNSLDLVPFAETSVSAGARRIDTFDGNLYVLDVSARQVWRYLPSGDGGYSGLADAYFAAPPEGIDNAIDLAIDGSVYLIEASGRIHKYFAREEVTFSLAGLPAPITRPAALAVDPGRPAGESSVYVADLDGARVVQFAPDGRFVRQIRSIGSEFDALEDIWIDETTGRLYAISGGRVYAAVLPGASAP